MIATATKTKRVTDHPEANAHPARAQGRAPRSLPEV